MSHPEQKLDGEKQAQLQGRLAKEMRTNTYDPNTGTEMFESADIVRYLETTYAEQPRV